LTRRSDTPKADIEALKRNRPEAFDEQDVPDITDLDQDHAEALWRAAPDYLRFKPPSDEGAA
jgi:hypothetical protein